MASTIPLDLGDIDRFILFILQQNGELSLRKISTAIEEKFGESYSISAIKNHLDSLRDNHVIKDIVARIDCSLLGYREMTVFQIKVAPQHPIEEIGNKVAEIKETNFVYQITGSFQLLVMAKRLEKMEQISLLEQIKQLEGVEEVNTQVIMRRFKEDLSVKIPGVE